MSGREEQRRCGKALREKAPRSSHGKWKPDIDRPDPLALLQAQDKGRLEHLLPIKYGRMVVSPFGFLRGSAVVMTEDLSSTPVSGIDSLLCGDAHLSNFGLFATPERKLVFDVNDFDEAYHGPWEWDVKRLAASAAVAGRQNGLADVDNRELAIQVAATYRESVGKFSQMPALDLWYFEVDIEDLLQMIEDQFQRKAKTARKVVKKARGRTQEATLEKITEVVDGKRRFINNPPLLVRFEDLLDEQQKGLLIRHHIVRNAWRDYLRSLPEERRVLLERFRIADIALRVGGVGSVGTRCGIVLLEGDDSRDSIILQLKEAGPSVLEPYVARREYDSPAHRVVVCQRLLQAASDMFLGWHEGALYRKHFYWRQLKDMKGSIPVEDLDKRGLDAYMRICSLSLARAHSRTGDPAAIAGYLGTGGVFDRAIGDFAISYADQTERDHSALVKAVRSGKLPAETGV